MLIFLKPPLQWVVTEALPSISGPRGTDHSSSLCYEVTFPRIILPYPILLNLVKRETDRGEMERKGEKGSERDREIDR